MTKDVVWQVANPIYTMFRAEIHDLPHPFLEDNKQRERGSE